MSNVQNRQAAGLFIGRILLGLIFLISGIGKILRFAAVSAYMSSKGMPMAELFLVGTIALEVVGGLAVIIGWKARWAASVIFLFLIPVTLLFHPFWDADQASYQNQLNHFLKNLAIMGGMAYVALLGAGRFSIDQCAENQFGARVPREKISLIQKLVARSESSPHIRYCSFHICEAVTDQCGRRVAVKRPVHF